MSDLMKLTTLSGEAVWINPEMICTVEANGSGSLVYVEDNEILVEETPEKIINERRAAMERQP